MSKSMIITEVGATGEELNEVISQVEPILSACSPDLAVIACLCMAATLMNPYATADDIQEVVYQTSQFMCLALDGKGDAAIVGSPAKGVMN